MLDKNISTIMLKYKSGNGVDVERASISVKELKAISTSFYYWWHNQEGTNTQEGFDKWMKENLDEI